MLAVKFVLLMEPLLATFPRSLTCDISISSEDPNVILSNRSASSPLSTGLVQLDGEPLPPVGSVRDAGELGVLGFDGC